MSRKTFPRARAIAVATEVGEALGPVVQRMSIAGSLRRGVQNVGDIEIVAEPQYQTNLFEEERTPLFEPIWRACERLGELMIRGKRQVKVADVAGVKGLKLDLFLVHPPAQWGSIYLIRTGPRGFSTRWVSRLIGLDMRHINGRVIATSTKRIRRVREDGIAVTLEYRGGQTIPTPNEEECFRLAEMDFLRPRDRK